MKALSNLLLLVFSLMLSSAFMPACPLAMKTAAVQVSLDQQHLSQALKDRIYQKLDTFLEVPTSKNSSLFYTWLKEQPITSSEAQLAQVISLCNLGYYERRNGQIQTAIQYYSEGWNIYNTQQLSGFDILEFCLKPLGNLYTNSNALTKAQQTIELYLLRAEKEGRTEMISGGIANLSVIYQNQGNYMRAITILQEGLKRYPNQADLLTNLATNLFAANRYEEGFEATRNSLKLQPNQPNIYKLRAQNYLKQLQYDLAISELEKAVLIQEKDVNSQVRDLAKTKLAIAEIQVSKEDFSKANSQLKTVYSLLFQNREKRFHSSNIHPSYSQLYPENTLMDALDLHAHLANKEGDIALSLKLYEHAGAVSELLNTAQKDQRSQLLMQSSNKKRIGAFLDLAYEEYQKTNDQTILNQAFLMAQKAVAGIVSEAYLNKKQRRSHAKDTIVIELEHRETKQSDWRVQIYEAQQAGIPNLIAYAAILDSLDRNGYQMKELQKQLLIKFPDLVPPTETSLNAVQTKAKRKGHTFVSYFMDSQRSYQFVISENEVAFNRLKLGQEEQELFKKNCLEFIQYFGDPSKINNDPNSYAKSAYKLYKDLELPQAKQLIIIPDSFLQFVPFDALLSEETSGFQYREMPFLFKKTSISYALSPLLYIQEDIPMTDRPSALGVFPVFEDTDEALTYSLEEAEALEALFPGEFLFHYEASVAGAFAKASKHQILHFSTHASGGSFQTPAYLRLHDTSVAVEKLYGDQWQPELVVLSACETGIGTIISGEGAQSLARGFQYAGAQNIAFTLWQVNDKATAILMSSYYQQLKKTHSRDESLRMAKTAYLEDTAISNTKKSPYYWASFVYYGTTDIPQSSSSWYWWLAVGIIILFLGFLLTRKHGITS